MSSNKPVHELSVLRFLSSYGVNGRSVLNHWLRNTGYPDIKVHGAHMGRTWVLSAPGDPHVGTMNLAIKLGPRYTSANAGGRGHDTADAVLQGPHCMNVE